MKKNYIKSAPEQGNILGIRFNSTSTSEVLNFVKTRLETKEKFYILTINPEIVLIAKDDWLLKRVIKRCDISIPDGIGIKFAYKYLHHKDIEVIKGRNLFLDLIKLADDNHLKVFLLGGWKDEAERAKRELEKVYKNVIIHTHVAPSYNHHCRPISTEDKIIHRKITGSIKLFGPDLVFVGIGAPKQEKWIFRYFFNLGSTGAMTVGGTFNSIAKIHPLPPKWMEDIGLEWLWRLITEPYRVKRIWNATVVFTWRVFWSKFIKNK